MFDSSTLIAAMVEAHPNHDQAFSWLLRAKAEEFELVVSAHSLLEVYSVLTTAPFKPRISPETAKKLIDANIKNIATIHALNTNDYLQLIHWVSDLNIKGGIVYDALILQCAKKAGIKEIVTMNAKDFNRIWHEESIKIISI